MSYLVLSSLELLFPNRILHFPRFQSVSFYFSSSNCLSDTYLDTVPERPVAEEMSKRLVEGLREFRQQLGAT